jgi:hypothetical protein
LPQQEITMTADPNNNRAQSRLEKAARENEVSVDYEVQARLTREKTAKLRALRLAKEAAEKDAGNKAATGPKKSRQGRQAASKEKPSLADWLAGQSKSGRRS